MAIINDIRLLVLNACSTANQSRNDLALRAVNPACSATNTAGQQYTMPPSEFRETLAQQAAMQRTLRTSQPRRTAPQTQRTSTFFRDGPPVERARPRTHNHSRQPRRPPNFQRPQQQ